MISTSTSGWPQIGLCIVFVSRGAGSASSTSSSSSSHCRPHCYRLKSSWLSLLILSSSSLNQTKTRRWKWMGPSARPTKLEPILDSCGTLKTSLQFLCTCLYATCPVLSFSNLFLFFPRTISQFYVSNYLHKSYQNELIILFKQLFAQVLPKRINNS